MHSSSSRVEEIDAVRHQASPAQILAMRPVSGVRSARFRPSDRLPNVWITSPLIHAESAEVKKRHRRCALARDQADVDGVAAGRVEVTRGLLQSEDQTDYVQIEALVEIRLSPRVGDLRIP